MDESDFLLALAEKLRTIKIRGIASQSELAKGAKTDQETVSKVANGRRKRRTSALNRLDKYADMLLGDVTIPADVTRAVSEFLVHGTGDELIATIRLCTSLVTRRPSASSSS